MFEQANACFLGWSVAICAFSRVPEDVAVAFSARPSFLHSASASSSTSLLVRGSLGHGSLPRSCDIPYAQYRHSFEVGSHLAKIQDSHKHLCGLLGRKVFRSLNPIGGGWGLLQLSGYDSLISSSLFMSPSSLLAYRRDDRQADCCCSVS